MALCPHCGSTLDVLLCPDGHGKYYRIPAPCTCPEAKAEILYNLDERKRRTAVDPSGTGTVPGIGAHFLSAKPYGRFAKYVEEFTRESAGLVLSGAHSTGKTYAAAAVALAIAAKGYTARMVTEPALIREIRDGYGTMQSEQHVIDSFLAPDLLVIDDLGKSKVTDWLIAQLFAVIDGRYAADKITIFTTDRTDTQLLERWSLDKTNAKAILRRIGDVCLSIDMKEVRP
jgi:DNA replication protein DnaC